MVPLEKLAALAGLVLPVRSVHVLIRSQVFDRVRLLARASLQ
jgi:hypothetical protein